MDDDLWIQILAELRLRMTTATFNTWFVGSRLVRLDGDELVIAVQSGFAKDWIENRMMQLVVFVATAVAGRPLRVSFVVAPSFGLTVSSVKPIFPGFEPVRSNYVQMPRQFFEHILVSEPPVVIQFCAAVVAQTYGVILNFHTGERREWWEASQSDISILAGIKSRASVMKAIFLSRSHGYVIRADGVHDYKYRLRRLGEPMDDV